MAVETICFNRVKYSVIMTFTSIVLAYLYFWEQSQLEQEFQQRLREMTDPGSCSTCDVPTPSSSAQPSIEPQPTPKPQTIIIHHQPRLPSQIPLTDAVRQHDIDKITNPLEAPTRRSPYNQLPPATLLPISTRGAVDNYQQLGVLVRDVDGDNTNKVLRLFGRPTFPGSNKFEYYTMINNGLDQIKLPIESTRSQELYNDDLITVEALDEVYKVQLHPQDTLRYNPYL